MNNALMKAVYDALRGNVPLMTKIGGTVANGYKCHHIASTDKDTAAPYLTFGMISDVPMGTFTDIEAMEDATFYVNIWSNAGSAKEAGEILDLVDTVLNGAALVATGFSCMKCVREYIGGIIYDDTSLRWLLPIRYRVWLDKN